MNRFTPVLTRLNEDLALPQPARSRVLLEIAADLEAFFEIARRQGHPESEAERLALEAFNPSSEAVSALVRVHCSPVASLMDGLAGQAQGLWERLLLVMVTVVTLALIGPSFLDLRIVRVAGWVAWPICVLALSAIVLGLTKVYLLHLKHDHRPRALRRGIEPMLWLAVAPAFLGFVFFSLDLYRGLGLIAATWPEHTSELSSCLLRGHAVLAVAFAGTLVASVLWFFITRSVSAIEEHNARLLLQLEGSV